MKLSDRHKKILGFIAEHGVANTFDLTKLLQLATTKELRPKLNTLLKKKYIKVHKEPAMVQSLGRLKETKINVYMLTDKGKELTDG